MTFKTAVMICGHGSRDLEALSEFGELVMHLQERFPNATVESGFLEFAKPTLRMGLDRLKEHGAKRIFCLLAMLFSAGHVKNDIPSEINEFAAANPDLDIRLGRDLAIDTRLLIAAKARIEEAEHAATTLVTRQETLLLVVGRGTSDPDANSNVSKIARMLWEGMNFGWCEVGYSGVAYPLVDMTLKKATQLGYKRIIVFPYFLFTGRLVKKIYHWVDEAAAQHPNIEFLKASYLNDHNMVVDTFVARVEEVSNGNNVMNCQFCKYREQIIGYENQVGVPQVGHHHHVRGIGTDADEHLL